MFNSGHYTRWALTDLSAASRSFLSFNAFCCVAKSLADFDTPRLDSENAVSILDVSAGFDLDRLGAEAEVADVLDFLFDLGFEIVLFSLPLRLNCNTGEGGLKFEGFWALLEDSSGKTACNSSRGLSDC